jgi:hypothetical protein
MRDETATKPTEYELEALQSFLLSLPFMMANLGHRTIKGHACYVHSKTPLVTAMAAWLVQQNDETWADLIAAWGEDHFRNVRSALMLEALPTLNLDKAPEAAQ